MRDADELEMKTSRYQDFVSVGQLIDGPKKSLDKLFNLSLGVCGESGEVADCIKKMHRDDMFDNPEMIDHLSEELGDLLWYIAQVCNEFDLTLSSIMWQNIVKLTARYPDHYKIWLEKNGGVVYDG